MTPTAQQARQIELDKLIEKSVNDKFPLWDFESVKYKVTIEQYRDHNDRMKAAQYHASVGMREVIAHPEIYLTRLDAPTAGDGEDAVHKIIMKYFSQYCSMEECRSALFEILAAPQNAAGDETDNK